MKIRDLLSSTAALAWTPASLCLSDAGAGAADAGGTGGSGGSAAGASGAAGAAAAAGAAPPALTTEQFLGYIAEDIRGDASLKDIKNVDALARSYINGQKMHGVPPDQLVRLAGPDDAEGWNGIYNKLGRPEKADGYQLADPDPKELPAGLVQSPEAKAAFAIKAHELGLSQKQADALYGYLNGSRIAAAKALNSAAETANATAITTLKRELGEAFDLTQENQNLATDNLEKQLVAKGLLTQGELTRSFAELPAAARGPFLKAFAAIGAGMREDPSLSGRGGGAMTGVLSPAEAKQQIAALESDPQMMTTLRNRNAPGYAEAVAKRSALYAQAYPTQSAA